MELLPVEVIGNILSHLGAARDVVIASATCRKWRVAARYHLHTLSFDIGDWQNYNQLPTEDLEVLITQTILQTSCLQHLSICLGNQNEFSAAPVIAWLMYTRESLRFLTYMMQTKPCVNVLERCGRSKLERLVLGHTCIPTIDPSIQRFPALLSLTLSQVIVSSSDLNALLSACPKLETFILMEPEINPSGSEMTVSLTSSSLLAFYMEDVSLENFTLKADHLESLVLRNSSIERFSLKSRNSLHELKIDSISITHMDIGEATDLLEVLDVREFEMPWPQFFQMISGASKLQKLRLWCLRFEGSEEGMGLETIAVTFPRLSWLALSYDLAEGLISQALQGASLLENVVSLELGSTSIDILYAQWIGVVIERCPSLRRVVIHGNPPDIKQEDIQMIGKFTTSILNLMRKFPRVEIEFKYSCQGV